MSPRATWIGSTISLPFSINARLAARLAREGECKGILFDVEPYQEQFFDFHKQKNAAQKSWADYTAQARRRGRELMDAFQEGFPGLTIFQTFGYSIAWLQMENGKKPLADCQYTLLPALLDGMIEAARGKTRIVDGCEAAYSFKDLSSFERQYKTMKEGLLPIVAEPKKCQSVVSLGFGLWMDYDSHKKPWDTNDFSKNYYTPAQFEASVRKALQVADEYVWIYTEQPRWWTSEGPPIKLPVEYDKAIRNARKDLK